MNAITIAHLSDIHHNPDENSQISTLLWKNSWASAWRP